MAATYLPTLKQLQYLVALKDAGHFGRAAEPLNALSVNIINFSFLMVGILLHRTPARLMHAVASATPAVWGVILQFPFYAGIAAIITTNHMTNAAKYSSSATIPVTMESRMSMCLICIGHSAVASRRLQSRGKGDKLAFKSDRGQGEWNGTV